MSAYASADLDTVRLADAWRAGNPEERFWQILSHQLAVRIPEIGRQRLAAQPPSRSCLPPAASNSAPTSQNTEPSGYAPASAARAGPRPPAGRTGPRTRCWSWPGRRTARRPGRAWPRWPRRPGAPSCGPWPRSSPLTPPSTPPWSRGLPPRRPCTTPASAGETPHVPGRRTGPGGRRPNPRREPEPTCPAGVTRGTPAGRLPGACSVPGAGRSPRWCPRTRARPSAARPRGRRRRRAAR